MATVKVKDLLGIINSLQVHITVKTGTEYTSYLIDYCAKGMGIIYEEDGYVKCTSEAWLPEPVLNRTVTFINAFNGRVDLCCYEEE